MTPPSGLVRDTERLLADARQLHDMPGVGRMLDNHARALVDMRTRIESSHADELHRANVIVSGYRQLVRRILLHNMAMRRVDAGLYTVSQYVHGVYPMWYRAYRWIYAVLKYVSCYLIKK